MGYTEELLISVFYGIVFYESTFVVINKKSSYVGLILKGPYSAFSLCFPFSVMFYNP